MVRFILYLNILFFIIVYVSCEKKTNYSNNASLKYATVETRCIENGSFIYSTGYIDQPYIIRMPNNKWICFYSKSDTAEGAGDGRIGVSISADKGGTWQTMPDLKDKLAFYATPFMNANGRIYVFYVFNKDSIRYWDGYWTFHILGELRYVYSDDNGINWSNSNKIDMPVTNYDSLNLWKGKYQRWWTICKPILANNEMYLSFTKKTSGIDRGEGWVLKSTNINSELNINKLDFQFMPSSNFGIRSNTLGNVQEEHNIVQLNNGGFCCVLRTMLGVPGICYSYDGCKTWTNPVAIKYPNGDSLRHPKACPRIVKCNNGKYILWFHNNSNTIGFRNPVWVTGGLEVNGKISWSQPEVFLYSKNDLKTLSISYPDFIEDGQEFYVTETDKKVARINKIDRSFFEQMWSQEYNTDPVTDNVLQTIDSGSLMGKENYLKKLNFYPNWKGVSVILKLQNYSFKKDVKLVVLFQKNDTDTAIVLRSNNGNYFVDLYENKNKFITDTLDFSKIFLNKSNVISFSIDNEDRVLKIMVNGILCRGNYTSKQGWFRIPTASTFDFNLGQTFNINNAYGNLKYFKLYSRGLSTSEQIRETKRLIK